MGKLGAVGKKPMFLLKIFKPTDMKNTEYKKCDKCCYDILDDDGNVMEHYCIDNNLNQQ